MRICIVGKFPPIEGGVSMLNYRYAHALARQGHQVHHPAQKGCAILIEVEQRE